MPGTTEGLALELAAVLEPLEQRLATSQGTISLFAELGLPLPPAVVAVINAAPEVPQIVTSVGNVAAEVPALVTAIGNADTAAIAASVSRLAPHAQSAFSRIQALATTVQAAFPADLSAFPQEVSELITKLPERLVAWLVVGYLDRRRPVLASSLALPGIAETIRVPAAGTQTVFRRRELHPERIVDLLTDPEDVLERVYGWGSATAPLDASKLFERLLDLLDAAGLHGSLAPGPELRAVLFKLAPGAAGPPTALDLTLALPALSGIDLVLTPPGARVEARLRAQGNLDIGAGLRIQPPARVTVPSPTGTVDGEVTLSVGRSAPTGQRLLLFGQVGGTRVAAETVRAAAGAQFALSAGSVRADVVVTAEVRGGQVVVAFGGADGFLRSFLPATSTLDVDLGARWSGQDGLSFTGGAALSITIPLALELGPARLDRFDLAVRPQPGSPPALALEARVAGNISLGPFAAAVQGVGAGADVLLRGGATGPAPPAGAVDLGPVSVAFRFLPPTGLGLSVAAGPVKGGGFIDYNEAAGRYSGLLRLKLGEIGLTALGLLDTRLPGGQQGFALLVVLRGQFPPIQVGFGFALSSVGGVLALNRRIDVDALRARFATGSIGRILAPEDPVRDAPVLFADLGAVFPPAGGVVVVGPTLQLSWVEIVRLDLGIFVELPPLKIVLLGSARAAIPNPAGGRPVLQIRLDIIGLLDFQKKVLEFDAVLIDSHLLEILELTGGAAMRLSWGDEPYVVLTVGGFHPGYSPAPLTFPPSLTRVAMVRGTPTDFLYLRFEGYFAITTNTLQFGASVELIINLGPINARGFLGFDALIRFKPFGFEFAIEASVRVRWQGVTLAGVELRGTLTGPGPVTLRGRICFEILWFEICWEETFTLGSPGRPAVTPVASAVTALTPELEDPANLAAGGGDDPHVALAPDPTGLPLPLVRPLGQLSWGQERAPLDLLLERFEGAPLARPETVRATGPHVTGAEVDWFAPGGFAALSDADALNRQPFERLNAGVRLGLSGVSSGGAKTHDIQVEQIRVPVGGVPSFLFAPPGWLLRAADARAGVAQTAAITPQLAVHDLTWNVVDSAGVPIAEGVSQAQAHQLARHADGVAVASSDPVAAVAF
jgi:hypothetical protein